MREEDKSLFINPQHGLISSHFVCLSVCLCVVNSNLYVVCIFSFITKLVV